MHPTHRYFLWLALLVVALALLGFVFGFGLLSPSPAENTPAPAGFPAEAPPPQPQDYVAAQKGFQYLVSYTATGFAPAALDADVGETVRFTNNSDGTLRLSLSGEQTASLERAAYFEYTFYKAGTFVFSDGTNTSVVTVK